MFIKRDNDIGQVQVFKIRTGRQIVDGVLNVKTVAAGKLYFIKLKINWNQLSKLISLVN